MPDAFLLPTAGRLGIEPRFTASKAAVLPLDDLPAVGTRCKEHVAFPNERRQKALLSIRPFSQ